MYKVTNSVTGEFQTRHEDKAFCESLAAEWSVEDEQTHVVEWDYAFHARNPNW